MESEIYVEDRLMEGERFRSFEELRCWQLCREFKLLVIREVLPKLPKEERFRIADQIIRAARSTAANIAEGYGRFHYADNAKFVSSARGSCHEVLDHLISACDEGLITESILAGARTYYEPALLSKVSLPVWGVDQFHQSCLPAPPRSSCSRWLHTPLHLRHLPRHYQISRVGVCARVRSGLLLISWKCCKTANPPRTCSG